MTHDDTGRWYPSSTYRYSTPEGSAYVTVARGQDGIWVDCSAGKSGSEVRATSHALSAVCGMALRHGLPAIKLVHALKEITHENSGTYLLAKRAGRPSAASVPDAIGDALWQELT